MPKKSNPSSNAMPKKAVSEQGYIFVLPSLGLPDPQGDWVTLKVAFGTRERANQLIKDHDDSVELPRRYMSDRNSLMNLDYEGAMWILPLVAPQKQASEGEVFSVKARRMLSILMPEDYRPRLPKGVGRFEHMGKDKKPGQAPPDRLAKAKSSVPATQADEDAFWADMFGDIFDEGESSSLPSRSSTPSPDDRGYLFHLPSLGIPDSEGEWVTVRAASGTKEQCASLLTNGKPLDAPLRDPRGKDKVVDTEFQGCVWLLPTTHLQEDESKSELFSVRVYRKPAASVPGRRERMRHANSVQAVFVNKSKHEWDVFKSMRPKVENATLPESKAAKLNEDFSVPIPTPSNSSPDGFLALEGLKVFQLCVNPTSAQSKALKPPKDAAEVEQWKKRQVDIGQCALDLWRARGPDCVSMDWIKEAHIEAARAGLRKFHWDPRDGVLQLANMRQSPEVDGDVRGMEYALNEKEARRTGMAVQWRPLPAHAADEEWVRCGVNIVRRAMGKKLFTKDGWPNRRPTTLMLKHNMSS